MTPPGDDMGIGVFFVAAGTEQVVQQRLDVLPRGVLIFPITRPPPRALPQGLAHRVGNRVERSVTGG